MRRYNPQEIEPKWQKIWEETGAYLAEDFSTKPKKYVAGQFPYPSGAGLHAGHARVYTITDALARFYRAQDINVLNPIGWDTFGMPAENYAIKTGRSPQDVTAENIATFKNQFKRLGISIDWSREINTSDPEYYRWTQWIFLQLYKKGLAYRAENYQWWCPVDQTVLANEQVENGHCWRCGSEVEKRKMQQWFFKITEYADELLDGLSEIDWPESVKSAQRNWIGRSVGADIVFDVVDSEHQIKVFTTRPDTIFGATFLVLAPEHPLVEQLINDDTRPTIDAYRTATLKKSEIERQENREKTGVFTGSYALNPATGEQMPIWIADYVLLGYGEGAIMAVPAHDERDYEFADKFELPIKQVIEKPDDTADVCYSGEGKMINSGTYNGMQSSDAREEIVSWLTEQKIGKRKITYRMRDWLISRQRYWGAPIPIAYDKDGNPHPVPEDKLPLLLPQIDNYQPDNSGRSALAKIKDWTIEIDGEQMQLETDTMDGFACSSWYLLRYADPHNDKQAWDKEKCEYWNPVDVYVGGDHATTHQLYVRFWTYVFRDLGLLDFSEPITKFIYHGYILAEDGTKMSKSKGNVIDPLDVVDQGYGADALRTYILFMGPYEADVAWDTRAIGGVYRFLNRCWTLSQQEFAKQSEIISLRHQTIRKVTEDLHRSSFNTAVAALMEFVNALYKQPHDRDDVIALAKLLSPFAPHLSCEILEVLGSDDSWPTWEEQYLVEDVTEVVVQVNGKLRAKLQVPSNQLSDKQKLEQLALDDDKIKAFLDGKKPTKVIIVPNGKLINLVIK